MVIWTEFWRENAQLQLSGSLVSFHATSTTTKMNKHPKRGLGSKKKTNELVAGLSRWAEVDMGLSREVLPSNDEFKA